MNKTKKIFRYLRWTFLSLILIYISIEAYLHQVFGGVKAASVHALCPYGGLETLYSIMFAGTFVKKIFSGTMILLILSIIISILFRRGFCGFICPFGALQELFAKIGQKIFHKRLIIPNFIDKPLRYLKYIILILTVVAAWITGELWMSQYDPYAAYGHLFGGIPQVIEGYLIGLIILVITIIGSFFYDRTFCKYLCPAGAFYGIIGKLSPNKIARNDKECTYCKICNKACPVNINVAETNEITSIECISCHECINVCPKKDVLNISQGKIVTNSSAIFILIIVIFFGGVFISKSVDVFQTTSLPVIEENLENVESIKGYMTLSDVAEGRNISIKELYKILDIPDNVPKDIKLKELSTYVKGYTPETVREKLK